MFHSPALNKTKAEQISELIMKQAASAENPKEIISMMNLITAEHPGILKDLKGISFNSNYLLYS